MRFWILLFIAVMLAAFGSGYLGLELIPSLIICFATAFATALVQMTFFSGGAPVEGHDPFSGGEERET